MVRFSKSLVSEFYAKFKNGDYAGQRLGQAFFNHFNLHKMNDNYLENIYNVDDASARAIIAAMTDHNN